MNRTEWRDARLARALDEAPDAQLRPLDRTRDAIRAAAREAVTPAVAAPWWRRLWEASGRRSGWTPALATVLLAGLVTLLWRGEEVPTAKPDSAALGQRPAAPTPPATVNEADPAAAPQAKAPSVEPVLRDAPAANRQPPTPQPPQARRDASARKAAAPAAAPAPAAEAPRAAPPAPASPPAAPTAATSPPAASPAPAVTPAAPVAAAPATGAAAARPEPAPAAAAPPAAAASPGPAAAPPTPSQAAPAPAARPAPPPQPAATARPPAAEFRAAAPESRGAAADSRGDLAAAAPLGRARTQAQEATAGRLDKSAAAPAASTAAAPQRESADALQAQQLSWEAWTELRITAEARAVVLSRRRAPQLADSLNRLARQAQSLEPMNEPVRASFELSSRGTLLGVLEVGDSQVRWLPLGERGPSRTARPEPALLQAVREEAAALLPR